MVEVIINGTSIDLISKGVKYTKQVNDLADLSTVNTSFTYSLRADKTPKNTQLFQQLGMVGDTSEFPYVKNTAQLIDNGAMLISQGWATVKETNDDYKLFIQDGIIEVFKLIENKTLGKWLDLSELSHVRNAGNIIDTWLNDFAYRYLLADYGGRINSDDGVIEADYLIPSANVKYFWDKIFQKIGYTYSGVPTEIERDWITYPKEGEEGEEEVVFKGFSKPYKTYSSQNINFGTWPTLEYREWLDTGFSPIGISVLNDWILRIDEAKKYQFEFRPTTQLNSPYADFGYGLMEWWVSPVGGHFTGIPFWIRVYVDGQVEGEFMSDSNQIEIIDLGTLNVGAEIDVKIEPLTLTEAAAWANENNADWSNNPDKHPTRLLTYGLSAWIYTPDTNVFDFQEAFGEFSVKDFFKEVMFRFGLTPFVDNHKKHIEFITLSERLDTSNAINWSEKYIRRTNEIYVFDDYAKKNVLRMKYNNEEDSYADGSLYVQNDNLKDEKRILESKFFAPERNLTPIKFNSNKTANFPYLKIWEKEVKEVKDPNTGQFVQEVEYKALSNRFHYISESRFFSDINLDGVINSFFDSANINRTSWANVLQNYYGEIDKIFTDTRIHEIELALSEVDFVNIDMKKLYYFEQEKQYYIMNKIVWETGQPAKGEFIRVKRNG